MAKGYSLHFGLNTVDPNKYTGNYNKLKNAENDAAFYHTMATDNQFEATAFIGIAATSENLISNLMQAALKMQRDDTLFLTYSGHGTRVKDEGGLFDGDEVDGFDEALVMYDRLFIDDEFQLCWSQFKEGSKIFFINDSCFNGSVSRFLIAQQNFLSSVMPKHILRGIDKDTAAIDFQRNISYYKSIKLGAGNTSPIANCSIIHIGSCQDNQLADDGIAGDENGKFTLAVRKIYAKNTFTGSYKAFFDKVFPELPPWQTPSWETDAGKKDDKFEKSLFLKIQ